MISGSWLLNLAGGLLLGLIATLAMAAVKSTSLAPRSIFLWPLLVVLYGIINLIQAPRVGDFVWSAIFGSILILCGIQALWVNVRRLAPWPSGLIWLGLVFVGLGFQLRPLFIERVIGLIWMAIGMSKVVRERSATLETGTPIWIFFLYAQAILLAAYR